MDFVGGKIYDANGIATTLSTTKWGKSPLRASAAPTGACVRSFPQHHLRGRGEVHHRAVEALWRLRAYPYANPNNPLVGIANGAVAFMSTAATTSLSPITPSSEPTRSCSRSGWARSMRGDAEHGPARWLLLRPIGSNSFAHLRRACRSNRCSATAHRPPPSPALADGADAVSLAMDWRFARHFDFYAGVMYSQKQGGLANGYASSPLPTCSHPVRSTPSTGSRTTIRPLVCATSSDGWVRRQA